MTSEWPTVRIEEIAEKIAMGPFGSNIKVETFVADGIPIISGTHLHGTRLQDGAFRFITEEHAERLKNSNVYRGDVVFTHAGNIGQVAYIPGDSLYDRYVISQRQFYLRCDREKADPAFITYFFHSPEGRHQLLANASQVGVPSISRPSSNLKQIKVALPSLEEQRRIVEVIGAIEDRIELLQGVNATLEAIAQALFKSWFVDFEPVRAKAEGREPEGMDTATAALFPAEWADCQIGSIPEGWRVSSLGEAFEINPRRALKRGGLAKYLDMASVPTVGHVPVMPIDRAYTSGSRFKNGDTLLARITPCLENGKTAHVDFLDDNEVGWGSTEFVVLRPRAPLPPYFGYLLARTEIFRANAIQSMTGSSGRQRVRVDRLKQFPLVLPSDQVAECFARVVEPLRESILANEKRAAMLADLRDTLLPRLISGKLRLPDVARDIEAATA